MKTRLNTGVTLSPDTTPTQFAEWLPSYTQLRYPHLHPVVNGRSGSWDTEPLWRSSDPGAPAVLEIGGFPENPPKHRGQGGTTQASPKVVRFEIAVLDPARPEVTVTRMCPTAAAQEYADRVLEEIVRRWPGTIIRTGQPDTAAVSSALSAGKRGGPTGTPEDQKMEIVRGWLKLRGRVNQEIYAHSKGVGSSTLRRWMRELRAAGKL